MLPAPSAVLATLVLVHRLRLPALNAEPLLSLNKKERFSKVVYRVQLNSDAYNRGGSDLIVHHRIRLSPQSAIPLHLQSMFWEVLVWSFSSPLSWTATRQTEAFQGEQIEQIPLALA